jgi:hypothetical protein
MLQIVHLNGYIWYADVNCRVLYEDSDKKSGTPFSFLTKDELQQVQNELRFPRLVEQEV